MKIFVLQWIAILLLAVGTSGAQPRIWYVDADVLNPASGNSWQHATTLADALSQAAPLDTIWCKRGTYRICSSVPSGVCLFGGFEGWESHLNQRELNLNFTAFSPLSSNNLMPYYYSVLMLDPNFTGVNPYAYWHILSVSGAEHVLIDGFIFKEGGSLYTSGGGLYLDEVSTSVFRNLIFLDNTGHSGAGLYANYATDITMENVIFCNNNSVAAGGGMFLYECSFYIWNMLFVANQSQFGGGFFLDNSTAYICHMTTAVNMADIGRAGYVSNSTMYVHNSVIYGDTNTIDSIFIQSVSTPDIVYTYSILYPIASYYQDNTCSNVNPMLANPNDFNCSLQSGSPCINTGNNLYDPINITKDVIGNVRKWDGIVDRGAYEYQFIR